MNSTPSPLPRTSRRPLLLGGVLTLLLFVGTVAASLHLRQVEREDRADDFHEAAHDRVQAIRHRLEADVEDLRYVESLYLSSREVEREEFSTFVAGMLSAHEEILAAGWAPAVSAEGVDGLERRAREEGLAAYRVHDAGPDGGAIPRGDRPEYFPVSYLESRDGAVEDLGLDLASVPAIRWAIGVSRGLRRPVASAPMPLPGAPSRRVVWLVQPIRRQGTDLPLLGVTFVKLDVGAMVERALAGLSPGGISLEGRDEATAASAEADFSHSSRRAAPGDSSPDVGIVDEETFTGAVRRWFVRSRPVRAWLDDHESRGWWILLASGSALSLFFALSLAAAARRSGLVRRLVRERTAELARLIEILEGTTDFVGIATLDGRAIYMNGPGRRMLGIPPGEDLRGADISRYHPPWSMEIIRTLEFPTVLREGTWTGEYALLARDGTEVPVSAVAIRHLDEAGRPSCVSVVMRDISERKRIEERTIADYNRRLEAALKDLHRAQTAIRLQERLNALGQMTSGIAHDVNNALAPVVGFADLLLMDPSALADHEKATAYLTTIRTAAKDAAGVVRRLKEFYRKREESEPLAAVELNEIVEETVRLTRPRWRDEAQAAGVAIEARTELGERTKIAGIGQELREALTNLILNAVDAMPKGGTIRVVTARHGDKVTLSVCDTGVGMDDEVRRRCLEPFFTTKGKAGTGMGLAMVYGIACRHEGTIEIDSEPDKGTTFRLVFPAFGTAVLAVPAAAVPPPQRPRSLRVLVVDDEPLVREVVKSYLQLDGHDVETAPDGQTALETYRASNFDLVLTDSAMPGMRGEDLAREIRRIHADQRIAMLTGFGDVMRASERRPEAIDLVLAKPISIEDLRAAVSRLCSR